MLKSLFYVDGKPFFSIGGQVNNSSAYEADDYNFALDAVEEMGLNTVAAPVYWETLEPECGSYSFEQVEMVISETEKRGLKLVLLWFGTWKNGTSRYIPAWMKKDIDTYRPCVRNTGVKTAILTPLCEETRNKDAEAFTALAEYVEKRNEKGTVLALQVENEPGFLGTPRDYSSQANELFYAQIPKEVGEWAKTLTEGEVYEAYNSDGKNWPETFGFHAEELFSAYYVAKYIEYIAGKAKRVTSLPMYVNVWIREQQFRMPGIDYPSGGATVLALDLWKRMAPHIDCITPDDYLNDYAGYMELCEAYHRPDNILYIPESRPNGMNGRHLLCALEQHELSSIHCFGIDSIHNSAGELLPDARDFKDTVTVLSSMKPLIEKYQGTGKIYAVAQYEGMDNQYIDFGDYIGRIAFLNSIGDEPYIHLDSHHYEFDYMNDKGIGLIVYEGNGVFYLAGRGYKLILMKKTNVNEMSDIIWTYRHLLVRNIPYLTVDEGIFDMSEKFCVIRRRNGDETDTGIWVEPDVGVVRVEMV